jgi:soluble lytic murein transglycosylase
MFYIFLLSIKHKKNPLYYLQKAIATTKTDNDRIKALFWKYLLTKDKQVATEISKYKIINLYTLYIYEELDKEFDNIYTSALDYTVPLSKNPPTYNPFAFYNIKNEMKFMSHNEILKFSYNFNNEELEGIRAFIMDKMYKYQREYFISPIKKYLTTDDIYHKSLFLSIARQESRFIDSSFSTAYAIGMMQLIPTVIDEVASKIGKKVDYDELFITKNNVEYAKRFIYGIERHFKLIHPLTVAYSYNGGSGYFRNETKKGLFDKNDYDPFWSMEMISYDETREYGKKVLTNYIIYNRILDKNSTISLHSTLNNRIIE